MAVDLLWTGPESGVGTLVLGHGAGAAMDSVGMNDLADVLASRGIRTARFEFGYMAARREGVRKPPPRAESLAGEYRSAVEQIGGAPFIGGRSMGGRVATLVADELQPPGVVCFGYPFHPPAKPEQLRTAHLEHLRTPLLIVQGTRDEFGTRDDVAGYRLSPAVELVWLEDGDHGLRPRKAISGFTYKQHLESAADAALAFIRAR
ncbi:MAG: dienelactone hydrolase [Salinibacterium sp.]|nr:dienelactone hydrolase [Salinibacterium sp.]